MEEENRFREEFVYSKETLNSQIRDFGFWSLNCYDGHIIFPYQPPAFLLSDEQTVEGNTALSRYLLYRPTSTSYSVNKSAILSEKDELIEACLKTNYFGTHIFISQQERGIVAKIKLAVINSQLQEGSNLLLINDYVVPKPGGSQSRRKTSSYYVSNLLDWVLLALRQQSLVLMFCDLVTTFIERLLEKALIFIII
ncbi:hypothetical protein P8452_67202 [Trifolium repens]|nr:hypothetical protein P8452_67202 [Trifolium repens]